MNVRKVLVVEGLVNIVVCLCKLVIGISTQSTVILADAMHSATDVINNIIAWFAINIAEKPADSDHRYGHQKYEQLAVFLLAGFITIVAFEILIHAFQRFGQPVEPSTWGLVVLIAALCINIALAMWERHWAKQLNSDILNADASHTFSDILTSVTVIVSWQLAAQGWYWIDAAFAIIMSLVLFYLAYSLFQKAIPILVDQTAVDATSVSQEIEGIEGVIKVTRVRTRDQGDNNYADIIVTVNADYSLLQSHEIANEIEALVASKYNIQDAVVHIEPHNNELET
jgi:cation diffusion facilitator family transporter